MFCFVSFFFVLNIILQNSMNSFSLPLKRRSDVKGIHVSLPLKKGEEEEQKRDKLDNNSNNYQNKDVQENKTISNLEENEIYKDCIREMEEKREKKKKKERITEEKHDESFYPEHFTLSFPYTLPECD